MVAFACPTSVLRSVRRASFLLLCLLVVSASAEGPSAVDEAKAEAALRLIEKRIGQGKENEKARRDLVAFRVMYAGTLAAMKAASLLARLSSPLDLLDPKTIAPLERFDWQPKELVGVLGEHRGRHGNVVT